MKVQALLATLLQATTALSYEGGETNISSTVPDCTLPCKTKLRLSASKLKECLEANCGSHHSKKIQHFDVEEENNGSDFLEGYNGCVARCKRLRFGPHKQEQCIEECDQDNGSRQKPTFDTNDKENNDSDSQESPSPCVARCKRLRFGPRKQEQCIEECDQDNGSDQRFSFDTEDEENKDSYSQASPSPCVARCKRLRFGPHKQEQCIEECDQDNGSQNFDTNDEKNIDSDSQESPSPCVARCKRLRFGPHKQEQCIEECDQDNGSDQRFSFDAGDEETIDSDSQESPSPCVARCKRLRFGPHKQEQCIDQCDQDNGSDQRFSFDTEDEENNSSDSQAIPSPCVARCKRLRFGPHKQEQCIEECDQDGSSRDQHNEENDALYETTS